VVFNEMNLLNSLQRSCRAMDSHRLTDGEVLVARVNRRQAAKRIDVLLNN